MKQFTVGEQQKALIVEAIANKYSKDALFHSDGSHQNEASYFPNHILCWQIEPIEQASLANNVNFVPSPSFLSKSETGPDLNKYAKVKERFCKFDLKGAIVNLIERHEVLRSYFSVVSGNFSQIVLPASEIHFQIDDMSSLTKIHTKDEYINGPGTEPFDLLKPPLFKCAVLPDSYGRLCFLFISPKILFDVFSFHIISKDLWMLVNNQPLPLVNFSLEDCFNFNTSVVKRKLFNDNNDQNGLPLDYPRPKKLSFQRVRTNMTTLQGPLIDKLEFLSSYLNIDMELLFLGIFASVIARHSRDSSVVLTSNYNQRNSAKKDSLKFVGFLSNDVDLEISTRKSSKKEYLVDTTAKKDSYTFKEFFDNLKKCSNDVHSKIFQNEKLCKFGFGYYIQHIISTEDLYIIPKVFFKQNCFQDLRLDVCPFYSFDSSNNEKISKIELHLSFSSQLFKSKFMYYFLDHVVGLLTFISKFAYINETKYCFNSSLMNLKLMDLPMTTENEKRLLQSFNSNSTQNGNFKTTVDFFKNVMKSQFISHKIAVACRSDDSITFSELDKKSDQLACFLASHGCGPEKVIGLLMNRCTNYIVAILAIHKAGGAFLPLDIKLPENRLLDIIDDSKPILILCNKNLKEMLARQNDSPIFEIETALDNSFHFSDINLMSPSPENIAYILYTSGSTGKPKGVVIEQKSLISMIYWVTKEYKLDPKFDASAQYCSFSFDGSIFEIFPAIMNGISLYIVPEEIRFDFGNLCSFFLDQHITIATLPTSVAEQLLKRVKLPSSIRVLTVGGDVLRTYDQSYPKLINSYGLAETTVCATSFEVKRASYRIPIGKPIDNMKAFIVDKNGLICGIGVPGELCLCGPAIARGYINGGHTYHFAKLSDYLGNPSSDTLNQTIFNEKMTTEDNEQTLKYLSNFSVISSLGSPEEKVYKTGDICRWRSDGNIEYLGRADFQVKYRGYRMELGDIEQKILMHKKISGAVVVLREIPDNSEKVSFRTRSRSLVEISSTDFQFEQNDDSIDENLEKIDGFIEHMNKSKKSSTNLQQNKNSHFELVGYYESASKISDEELSSFLSQYLPEYMIPKAFIQVTRLPLTQEGKIDRKLLPTLPNNFKLNIRDLPPQTHTELSLCSCFSSVLGGLRVGIGDSFISLGGSSIEALQVVLKLHTEYNINIELFDLFKFETIKELASYIDKFPQTKIYNVPPPQPRISLASSIQKRVYYAHNMSGINAASLNRFTAIKTKPLNISVLKKCLSIISQKYSALRTSFYLHKNGMSLARILNENVQIPVSTIELNSLTDFQDSVSTFNSRFDDLSKAPLIRVVVFNFQNQYSILFICAHRLILDYHSLDIVVTELLNEYSSLIEQGDSFDTDNIISFDAQKNEVCVPENIDDEILQLEQESLNDNNKDLLIRQETFWKDLFKTIPPALQFPYDFQRPAVQYSEGDSADLIVGAETADIISRISSAWSVSAASVYLTAWASLLARYTRQDIICIGVLLCGRTNPYQHSDVGAYSLNLPVPIYIDIGSDCREMVIRVNHLLIEISKYQEYPLEKLVEQLGLVRDPSHTLLLDTIFSYSPKDVQFPSISGLQTEKIKIAPKSTYSDLSMAILGRYKGGCSSRLRLRYSTKLLKRASAISLLKHYNMFLASFVREPSRNISRIEVFSREDFDIFSRCNNTFRNFDLNRTFLDLLCEACANNPDKDALVFKDCKLSFKEVITYSKNLGMVISKLFGAEKERVVVIYLERCNEMVLGCIASSFAGAAFLALDSTCNKKRLLYILNDSKPCVVLTQPQLLYMIPKKYPVFNIVTPEVYGKDYKVSLVTDLPPAPPPLKNSDEDNWQNFPNYDLSIDGFDFTDNNKAGPDNLAYIVYTSGSTGNPKGVVIEHHSLVNQILWYRERFELNKEDIAVEYNSFSFDTSVSEVYCIICNGVPLHILADDVRTNFVLLTQYLQKHQITICDFPTTYAEQLAATTCPSVRFLTVGGDKLHFYLPINGSLINAYGPSECTITSTTFTVNDQYDNVPIGTPCANTRIYIVNSHMSLCSVGMPGELCISGPQLARKYLNRPELTSSSFVRCPFSSLFQPNDSQDFSHYFNHELMYRTGDLCRINTEGQVEYMGRLAFQAKMQGKRIEVADVEDKLLHHPYITAAGVLVKQNKLSNNKKYIVAYYSAQEEIKKEALIDFLAEDLPLYLIPEKFIFMNQLPLNTSGKIDKSILLQLSEEIDDSSNSELTEDEMKHILFVKEAFSKILNINSSIVSLDHNSNFFSLGGNSLQAIALAKYINKNYPLVSVSDILKYQTIKRIASYCAKTTDEIWIILSNIKKDISKSLQSSQDDSNDDERNTASQEVIVKPSSPNPIVETIESNENHELNHESEEEMEEDPEEDLEENQDDRDSFLSNYLREIDKVLSQPRTKNNYKTVLFTGSTGFLGSYLLKELIEMHDLSLTIICLIWNKEGDPEKALKSSYSYYFDDCTDLCELLDSKSLRCISGDLMEEHFGLSDALYKELLMNCDCVLHSGARTKEFDLSFQQELLKRRGNPKSSSTQSNSVNLMDNSRESGISYDEYYKRNVLTTKRVIDFCNCHISETSNDFKKKSLIYISTINVACGNVSNKSEVTFSEFDCNIGQQSGDYYTQTKLEAEDLVLAERKKHSFNVLVVRVGELSIDSFGTPQKFVSFNPLFEEIECLLHLGCVSESFSRVSVTPVDEAAKAILITFTYEVFKNLTIHIDNPYPISLARKLADVISGMRIVSSSVFIDFLMLACQNKDMHNNVVLFAKHRGWLHFDKPLTTKTLLCSSLSRKLLESFNFDYQPLKDEALNKIIISIAAELNNIEISKETYNIPRRKTYSPLVFLGGLLRNDLKPEDLEAANGNSLELYSSIPSRSVSIDLRNLNQYNESFNYEKSKFFRF